MEPSLLVTKLTVPRLRSGHISRPALLQALDRGLDARLILVAAGAGFGKTTLLAEWAAQHAQEVVWLSLDRRDNDPARFLSYLIAGIQQHNPALGLELLAAVQTPTPPIAENILHYLINEIAQQPQRLTLIIDDYHVVDNQSEPLRLTLIIDDYHVVDSAEIHTAVEFLLEYMPPQMTLVLATRVDPPLPLARLRARNELLEIRVADLRFAVAESADFLNQAMDLSLEAAHVQALAERTEGWIAGLHLAALALQSTEEGRDSFVREFTGSHRFIIDYLVGEVLERQPRAVRDFLLQTSVLERFGAALCAAVTGRDDSAEMLEFLDRNNLFISPLDQTRQWYRYHRLFADLLQARIKTDRPDLVPLLQQRAAHWLAENDFPEEATGYALAAGDYPLAEQLITGPAAGVMRRSEVKTLLEWFRALPPAYVMERPRLALHLGLGFALNGQWQEAESMLDFVQQQKLRAPLAERLMLAYLVASYRHDRTQLDAIAAEAEAEPQPAPLAQLVLALVVGLQGDLGRACTLAEEAHTASVRAADPPLAQNVLFHRCRLHALHGDLREAARLSRTALAQLGDREVVAVPLSIFAHLSLARTLYEWNQLPQAAAHAQQAIRVGELTGFVTGTLSSATMTLAEISMAEGDAAGAQALAERALALAARYDPPLEGVWLGAYRARLWLAEGNVAAAVEWLQTGKPLQQQASLFYPGNLQKVTAARVWLAQQQPERALTLLTALVQEPRDVLTVEAVALLALARQALGDAISARTALAQALALAQHENRLRALLSLGALLARLLEQHAGAAGDEETAAFARVLLPLLMTEPSETLLVEPLSERELEVLRLIAAGYTNSEISSALSIAQSTVKWYVNTLYGKLQVRNRAAAIARARKLRLVA